MEDSDTAEKRAHVTNADTMDPEPVFTQDVGADDIPDDKTPQSNILVKHLKPSDAFKLSEVAMSVGQFAPVNFSAKLHLNVAFVQSPLFHLPLLLVAVLNILALGFEMDMGSSRFFTGLKVTFFAVYLLEIILRMHAIGLMQSFKRLDLLIFVDLLVITCTGADVVINCMGKETRNMWSVSVLKILRISNIATLMQLRNINHELHFIVQNVHTALRNSLWICLVFGLFIYISSLLFTRTLGAGHSENEVIQEYWRTIPCSSLTLFAVATGQWEGVAHDLFDINPGMVLSLVAFVILSSMAILNLGVATTVESTLSRAAIQGRHVEGLTQRLEDIREKVDLMKDKQEECEQRLSKLQDSLHVTVTEEQRPWPPSPLFLTSSASTSAEPSSKSPNLSTSSASTSAEPSSKSPNFSTSSVSTSAEPSSKVFSHYWLLTFEADDEISTPWHWATEPVWLAKQISPETGNDWTWKNCPMEIIEVREKQKEQKSCKEQQQQLVGVEGTWARTASTSDSNRNAVAADAGDECAAAESEEQHQRKRKEQKPVHEQQDQTPVMRHNEHKPQKKQQPQGNAKENLEQQDEGNENREEEGTNDGKDDEHDVRLSTLQDKRSGRKLQSHRPNFPSASTCDTRAVAAASFTPLASHTCCR